MSALLTTTMVYMRTVVQKFKEAGLHDVKLCVGRRAREPRLREARSAPTATPPTRRARCELFQRLIAEQDAARPRRGCRPEPQAT